MLKKILRAARATRAACRPVIEILEGRRMLAVNLAGTAAADHLRVLASGDGLDITRNDVLVEHVAGLQFDLHFNRIDGVIGGGDTLSIEAGTVHLTNDVNALGSASVDVTGAGTVLEVDAVHEHFAALNIHAGAALKVQSGLPAVLVTPALSIDSDGDTYQGTIDLADRGALIERSTTAARDADFTAAFAAIKSAMYGDAGVFLGGGITSSAAAADTDLTLAVGILLNDDSTLGGSGDPLYPTLAAENIDNNCILIRSTHFGDADLSGVVDITDYFLIDNGFNTHIVGGAWLNGDFDFTGAVDSTDFFLIDQTFGSNPGLNAPDGLTVSNLTTTGGTVAWMDNATGESGYTLLIADAGGATVRTIPLPAHDGTGSMSCTVDNLDPGTTYQLTLNAYNATTTSFQAAVLLTTVLPAPTHVQALGTGARQITVSWDPADPSSGVTYSVHMGTTPNFVPSTANQVATDLNSSSYVVDGVDPSMSYYFQVIATNASSVSSTASSGNGGHPTAIGNSATATASSGAFGTFPRSDQPWILNEWGAANDLSIGFPINFYGYEFSTVSVSENGELYLNVGPDDWDGMIAPLSQFNDMIDSSTWPPDRQVGEVRYFPTTIGGRQAWRAEWDGMATNVPPSPWHPSSARNTFDATLVERSDTGDGNFDIVFHYDAVQWDRLTVDPEETRPWTFPWAGYDPPSDTGIDDPRLSYEMPGSYTPGGLIGLHGTYTYEIRSAPDLRIDSNNDGSITAPDDAIEHDPTLPGKLIAVNDDDTDGDGVIDLADFDGISGEHFVPMTLKVPDYLDLATAKIRLSYDDSPPPGVIDDTPAPGTLRVWTKPGDAVRNGDPVNAGGDWIEDGGVYTAAQLGLDDAHRERTLWVEAVRPSAALGEQEIWVETDPKGDGNWTGADVVRVTSVGAEIDGDNDDDGILDEKNRSMRQAHPVVVPLDYDGRGIDLLLRKVLEGAIASARLVKSAPAGGSGNIFVTGGLSIGADETDSGNILDLLTEDDHVVHVFGVKTGFVELTLELTLAGGSTVSDTIRIHVVNADMIFRNGNYALSELLGSEGVTHGGIDTGDNQVFDIGPPGHENVTTAVFYSLAATGTAKRRLRFDPNNYMARRISEKLFDNLRSGRFVDPSSATPWNVFSFADNYVTANCLEWIHRQWQLAIFDVRSELTDSFQVASLLNAYYDGAAVKNLVNTQTISNTPLVVSAAALYAESQAEQEPGWNPSVYTWDLEGDYISNADTTMFRWHSFTPSSYFTSSYFAEIPF